MDWVVIAALVVVLYVIRNLEVVTIKFKRREEPPNFDSTVNNKQLKQYLEAKTIVGHKSSPSKVISGWATADSKAPRSLRPKLPPLGATTFACKRGFPR